MGMWNEHGHRVNMEQCCWAGLGCVSALLGSARIALALNPWLTGTVQGMIPNEPWGEGYGARGERQVHS